MKRIVDLVRSAPALLRYFGAPGPAMRVLPHVVETLFKHFNIKLLENVWDMQKGRVFMDKE